MERFKLSILDWVSLVLTVVAAGLHFAGFFIKEWWINTNDVGTSHVGMMSLTVCEITCVNKSVLDIEEGNGRSVFYICNIDREWSHALLVLKVRVKKRRPCHESIYFRRTKTI